MRKINPTLFALCGILLWLGTAHAQRYVDNGDGTISDTKTGLMWEKKTEVPGVHDVNNRYTWGHTHANPLANPEPDGTAFTEFLGTLNHEVSSDGFATSNCFAHHCDWRLPTLVELNSIYDFTYLLRVAPIFGPTAPEFYWSSSTTDGAAHNGGLVWGLHFFTGANYGLGQKEEHNYVRAVRGPSCGGEFLCNE